MKFITTIFNRIFGTKPEPKRCGGCQFWRNIGEGECRFYPPELFMFENAPTTTGWPSVTESELSCGGWKPKP